MKKLYVLIFILNLTLILQSYEWVNFIETDEIVYNYYHSEADGVDYLATESGLRIENSAYDGLYQNGDLQCRDIWVDSDNVVYVIFGSGSYSDGLYTFSPETGFSVVDYYFNPKFIKEGTFTEEVKLSIPGNLLTQVGDSWDNITEFAHKDVFDYTESPEYKFASTDRGFYNYLIGDEGLFASRQNFGIVTSNLIDEASGVASSRLNQGVLWTHNDSGGGPFAYAMNELGSHLGIYTIAGANNRDWEDMAIGTNPTTGEAELYFADIGDNGTNNDIKYIYVVPEPVVSPTQQPQAVQISVSHTVQFRYPGDVKYDAETLLYDERTDSFIIITKRHQDDEGGFDRIFSIPNSNSNSVLVAEYLGNVSFPADLLAYCGATGGDISPDGNFILLKSYQHIFMWARGNRSIANTLAQDYVTVPYVIEPQGEAIAWRFDGNGYFTVSEEQGGIEATIYFYSKKRWRKASDKPIRKTEYNVNEDKLYGVIEGDGEDAGVWSSIDDGVNWVLELPLEGIDDINFDVHDCLFVSWKVSDIPEDYNRVGVYYEGNFTYLNDDLGGDGVFSMTYNNVFDHATIFISTTSGVKMLEDYANEISNSDNETVLPISKIVSFPNPFVDVSTIRVYGKNIKEVSIYNIRGQKIELEYNTETKKEGITDITWKANQIIPSGIYIVKVKLSSGVLAKKIVKL